VIERLKKSKNNIKNILQNEKNSFERNLKKKKEGFSKL
jgi:alanyl-tRNA synthetase